MAGEVTFTQEALQRATNLLDEAHSTVTALRTKLEASHSSLASAWRGPASSTFTSVYQAFDADMAKVLSAMQVLEDNMRTSHSTYVSTESERAQEINRISGAINR